MWVAYRAKLGGVLSILKLPFLYPSAVHGAHYPIGNAYLIAGIEDAGAAACSVLVHSPVQVVVAGHCAQVVLGMAQGLRKMDDIYHF